MNGIWIFISSLLAGIAASMGVGGGAILLLYLTAFVGINQLNAQGINLIFFIPIAIIAVCIHAKNKFINYKSAFICIAFGLLGVWAGLWLTGVIREELLSKLFALLLLYMGIRELLAKDKKKEKDG
ncbi:TSUP family transporter [Hydrogenoanaerobacterium sp.]|uniref:TSUP family transporter n=1 Tax=Hydrogenoanaerobacterium sp. TaxID=2953763 RepID=UPI00289F0697|nr:TSUP family transporter [Hydrogenoanaerobacterium sp.]